MGLFQSKKAIQNAPQGKTSSLSSIRKIILRQGQSPGDILTFTRAVGDLKESYPEWQIDVRTPCPEIWENNPRLTPLKENKAEVFDIGYDEINDCHWRQQHWTDAFRHDLEKKLGVPIKKTGIYPELWISDLEKSWINQVETEFGWKGPFWLLNAGRKQDNELKQYHQWQNFVNIFNQYFKRRVKLIQIGHADHIHPKLEGVLNLIGKTDTRQLIRLAYWAKGTIGPLSFQYVISAAFRQPAVVICGGKEDIRWHLYPHIRYLYTNGCLDCCEFGGCWLGGDKGQCKHLKNGIPKCFEMIKPHHILDAVKMYYDGGKL